MADVIDYNGVHWRYQAKLQATNPLGGSAGIFQGDPSPLGKNGGVIAFGVGLEGNWGTPQAESGAV